MSVYLVCVWPKKRRKEGRKECRAKVIKCVCTALLCRPNTIVVVAAGRTCVCRKSDDNKWLMEWLLYILLSFLFVVVLFFFFLLTTPLSHTHTPFLLKWKKMGSAELEIFFSPLFYDHKYKCFVSFVCVMKYALHKHLNGKCEFHIIIITTAHSTTRREYSSNLSKRVKKKTRAAAAQTKWQQSNNK